MEKFLVTEKERAYLRELAKRQREYANLPENKEKERLWYLHTRLQGERPMVVMEEFSFEEDILPRSQCESPFAQSLERIIQRQLINHELIKDDKVTQDHLVLNSAIHLKEFNIDYTRQLAKETSIAYQFEHVMTDLEEDLPKLRHSVFSYDEEEDRKKLEAANDILGDILPVEIKNQHLEWYLVPTAKAVKLMGMENFMIEMASNPEGVHDFMSFMADDMDAYLDWMEKNNLLTMNNGNDYAGAGSFGFTDELQRPEGAITTRNLWGNLNSQESSSISPQMYGELIFPYYQRLAKRFGLVYYGCCEPVHPIWEKYLSTLDNLRKVSISAWCDEEFMGAALKGTKTIYSRKPSPNFIGVGEHLDEEAFRAYMKKTFMCAKDCELEIIFRDIYTLSGDIGKPGRAVQIVRELMEETR